jgi:hypothetical protein
MVAMGGLESHSRVALVIVDDQTMIGGVFDRNIVEVDIAESQTMVRIAPKGLKGAAA